MYFMFDRSLILLKYFDKFTLDLFNLKLIQIYFFIILNHLIIFIYIFNSNKPFFQKVIKRLLFYIFIKFVHAIFLL